MHNDLLLLYIIIAYYYYIQQQLATEMSTVSSVVIAKMDATANDPPCK